MPAVSADQIAKAQAAKVGSSLRIVENADVLAAVCTQLAFPYWQALAILEKETRGRNVYGHDGASNLTDPSTSGYPETVGALANFEEPVTEGNYRVFRWLVDVQGMTSNGVGPMQLTWRGHFPAMAAAALEPWRPRDNIAYGVGVLKAAVGVYTKRALSQEKAFWSAARDYNGKTSYADDAVVKARSWFAVVGNVDVPTARW